MYGININDKIEEIRKINSSLLVIVGSQKVEGWYYYNSDYNIAIGNQPHSEVAALAIFLDKLYKGEELNIQFSDAKLKILPQERGKKVIKLG
jgi:tRNA (cytidine56-2'-O)-methyltransferase